MQRESSFAGTHLINERHGKSNELLAQIRTFLLHDRMKPAPAEITVPFLEIMPFDEADMNGCAMCRARKQSNDANEAADGVSPGHDPRNAAGILRSRNAVHSPYGFGHSIKRGAQDVAQKNVGHCMCFQSHDVG